MKRKRIVIYWLIAMFFVTFTCSLVYIVTQQTLRLGANELPKQFAVDTANKLHKGINAGNAIPGNKVDLTKSLSTFVMVYDKNKTLVATSGLIGKKKPDYPEGVLTYVDKNGEDRVTWQPRKGLRFATVATKYKDGYVVAGRSLMEAENLVNIIGKLVLLAWFAFAVFSALAAIAIYYFIKKVFVMEK